MKNREKYIVKRKASMCPQCRSRPHCHAHRLNLTLVDCVRNIQPAAEFFEIVQMLYNFFSGSVVHDLFKKKHKELEPSEQPVELKKLSETRWACQQSVLWAIKKSLRAILDTLHDIQVQTNARRKTDARAMQGLIDQRFVLHLVLFEDIFRVTKFASDQLQSPNLDISSANDLIQSVITALSEKRSEEYWSDIQNRANELCGKVGLASGSTPPQRRDARQSQRLNDFIIEAPINRAHSSNDDLRTDCFYQVVDRLVSELTRRFSKDADDVLTGVSALSPQHKSFLDKKCLLPMTQFYGITEENLNAEMHQVRRLLERKTNQGHSIKNTSELLLLMEPYKDAFMDLHKLILISLTLPVTSVM